LVVYPKPIKLEEQAPKIPTFTTRNRCIHFCMSPPKFDIKRPAAFGKNRPVVLNLETLPYPAFLAGEGRRGGVRPQYILKLVKQAQSIVIFQY